MKTFFAYQERYRMFMKSFKQAYPQLYDRYKNNITMPEQGAERPAINKSFPVSPGSTQILMHIIKEYYTTFDN